MSDDDPSTGIDACGSTRLRAARRSPAAARSSALKLSLTAQRPGRCDFCRMSTVCAARRSSASSVVERHGVGIEARHRLGIDPDVRQERPGRPCARHTASHQRALLRAAVTVQSFRPDFLALEDDVGDAKTTIMPAIRPVICGQIKSRLWSNGSGVPGIMPRASGHHQVDEAPNVRGLGIEQADHRLAEQRAGRQPLAGPTRTGSSDSDSSIDAANCAGVKPMVIAWAIIGHRMKKNSHRPSAHKRRGRRRAEDHREQHRHREPHAAIGDGHEQEGDAARHLRRRAAAGRAAAGRRRARSATAPPARRPASARPPRNFPSSSASR